MVSFRLLIVSQQPQRIVSQLDRLDTNGFEVVAARSREEAFATASRLLPKLIILDDELADANPFEFGWEMRRHIAADSMPMFFVFPGPPSKKGMKYNGTSAGAHLAEWLGDLSRMRKQSDLELSEKQFVECKGLLIDRQRHFAEIDGRRLDLTPTEFRLLWMMANRAGFVLPRDYLTKACASSSSTLKKRTIDAHIKSIRRKLRGRSDLIETVHGVGYRFQED